MIGKRIELLRVNHRMTQHALGKEVGVSQSKISRTENGRAKKVDFALVQRLARFFNVPIDTFLTDDPDTPLLTITVDRHSKLVPRAPFPGQASAGGAGEAAAPQ